MEPELSPLDLIDTGEAFDPQSWEHWGLVVMFIAFAIGGYIWIDRQTPRFIVMIGRQESSNPSTRIEKIISIDGLMLMVYYTSGQCWKYAIAGINGSYESEGIYYTARDAERKGRDEVKTLLG